MLNNCVFRGIMFLGEKDVQITDGQTKAGKDYSMCKFRVSVCTGRDNRKEAQEGDLVYATLFLNTFSNYVIDDIQKQIDAHAEEDKPKARVIVVCKYKPYYKDVAVEAGNAQASGRRRSASRVAETRQQEMPAWELVSLEFVDSVDSVNANNKTNTRQQDRPVSTGRADRPSQGSRVGAKNGRNTKQPVDDILDDDADEYEDIDDATDETAAADNTPSNNHRRRTRTVSYDEFDDIDE